MKTLFHFIFILFSINSLAQGIKVLEPTVGKSLDFGSETIKEWEVRDKALEAIEAGQKSWDDLTPNEVAILEKHSEIYENMWDIVGGGCSWYCGGSSNNVSASSYLSSQGSNSYAPNNAHDLNYQTAWVEGVDGYGIGQYLLYTFPQESPRITEFIIANGYIKSEKAWTENSRAKKLKVYFNDTPIAVFNLKDVRAEQHFKVSQLDEASKKKLEAPQKSSAWTLKFEIMEVYKGSKYADTAISEIYFDGIDVH